MDVLGPQKIAVFIFWLYWDEENVFVLISCAVIASIMSTVAVFVSKTLCGRWIFTHTHTHTVIMDIYFCCFKVWICYHQSYYRLFCFSQSFHYCGVFVVSAALGRDTGYRCPKITTEGILKNAEFALWDRGWLPTSWLCTFRLSVTDFWTPASVFTKSPTPQCRCFSDCNSPLLHHHLPEIHSRSCRHTLLLILHSSVLFLFPFIFFICYADEIIKKNISRSVRKWCLFNQQLWPLKVIFHFWTRSWKEEVRVSGR